MIVFEFQSVNVILSHLIEEVTLWTSEKTEAAVKSYIFVPVVL